MSDSQSLEVTKKERAGTRQGDGAFCADGSDAVDGVSDGMGGATVEEAGQRDVATCGAMMRAEMIEQEEVRGRHSTEGLGHACTGTSPVSLALWHCGAKSCVKVHIPCVKAPPLLPWK